MISYESHNKRLCKLRVKGKYNNITLINAYAPTEDKIEEAKEQFYDDLQSIVDKVPKRDITIIFGDVHQLFIDFKKAYDSVRREILYNILI